MSSALKEIAEWDLPVLEHFFNTTCDMSEFVLWQLCDDGCFAYPDSLLSRYWSKPDHHPYFISSGDEIAGFA